MNNNILHQIVHQRYIRAIHLSGGNIVAFLTLLSLICASILTGCAVEEPWGNPVSDPGEANRVEDILNSLAKDYTPGYRLKSAPDRGRWEDIDAAVNLATGEEGVEMGVLQAIEHDWGYIYELKTLEGWPVTMTIRRVEGRELYQASATVGHFPDLPERQARARKLLEAFDKMMQAFGRKKTLVPKNKE